MSWSISLVGKPQDIAAALDAKLASMNAEDYSTEEFAAAVPHLKGLLAQNFQRFPEQQSALKLVASGHGGYEAGSTTPKVDVYRNCLVSIEHCSSQIV